MKFVYSIFALIMLGLALIGWGMAFSKNTISEDYGEISPSPTIIVSVTPTQSYSPTATVTLSPTISPIPTSTNQNSNSNTWIYPGSTISSQSENSMVLTTIDTIDTVSDWYKQQIENNNFSSRTSVSTEVNGVKEVTLVSSNSIKEIRIVITKSDSETLISISEKAI